MPNKCNLSVTVWISNSIIFNINFQARPNWTILYLYAVSVHFANKVDWRGLGDTGTMSEVTQGWSRAFQWKIKKMLFLSQWIQYCWYSHNSDRRKWRRSICSVYHSEYSTAGTVIIVTGVSGGVPYAVSLSKPDQTGPSCICMLYLYILRIKQIEEDLGIWALCPR